MKSFLWWVTAAFLGGATVASFYIFKVTAEVGEPHWPIFYAACALLAATLVCLWRLD